MKFLIKIMFIIVMFSPTIGFAAETGYYDLYYFDNQQPKHDYDSSELELDQDVEDPFEAINKIIFSFNYAVDLVIIEPAAFSYKTLTPDIIQDSVKNFFLNLSTPISAINLLLQGRSEEAAEAVGRFITNSTLGCVGLFDIASEAGIEQRHEDFGRTLASYGFGNGPYLVLPIIGPSNFRDLIGKGVDFSIDPINKRFSNSTNTYLGMAKVVYLRAENYNYINNIKYKSLDPYVYMRSIYSQNRSQTIQRRVHNE
jgi:phospholipid-binding lipoprotein MlaA